MSAVAEEREETHTKSLPSWSRYTQLSELWTSATTSIKLCPYVLLTMANVILNVALIFHSHLISFLSFQNVVNISYLHVPCSLDSKLLRPEVLFFPFFTHQHSNLYCAPSRESKSLFTEGENTTVNLPPVLSSPLRCWDHTFSTVTGIFYVLAVHAGFSGSQHTPGNDASR